MREKKFGPQPRNKRYVHCLTHLLLKLGKDKPVKNLWIPDLRLYQVERLGEGAAPATVNREMSTLSKLFSVLMELQTVEVNPVRLMNRLSEKSSQREVYLSLADVQRIAGRCPSWFQSMIWTAYYTGMRRGEIIGLTRKQVDLQRRIIRRGPDNTKESRPKRVPIHLDLVPTLEQCMRIATLGSEKIIFMQDKEGVRPPTVEAVKNCWPRACESLKLEKPWPRFHDLRHTWKTNARRSGMDPEIRESILGHWFREKSVSERYGSISDQELINAIDRMTFDNGPTEIWAAIRKTKKDGAQGGAQNVRKPSPKKEKAMCEMA